MPTISYYKIIYDRKGEREEEGREGKKEEGRKESIKGRKEDKLISIK